VSERLQDGVLVPDVPLDRSSPVPLYFQVAQHLEHLIESGELAIGTRLENEIDLAAALAVSRPTMRRAIEYLVDRGVLLRVRGRGTHVVGAKMRRPLETISLYDHLVSSGRKPRTEVLGFKVERASGALAHALGISEGAAIYTIDRLRYAGEEPLALMRNHVPVGVARLTPERLEESGLYAILRADRAGPRLVRTAIGARVASAAEARVLDEKPGATLLVARRTAYDDEGRAVDHGEHLYRPSRYVFELTLTRG
jgi:GntR family transcriptional regulator